MRVVVRIVSRYKVFWDDGALPFWDGVIADLLETPCMLDVLPCLIWPL